MDGAALYDSGLMQVARFPLSAEMGSDDPSASWISRPQGGVLSHTPLPPPLRGSLSSAPAHGSDTQFPLGFRHLKVSLVVVCLVVGLFLFLFF